MGAMRAGCVGAGRQAGEPGCGGVLRVKVVWGFARYCSPYQALVDLVPIKNGDTHVEKNFHCIGAGRLFGPDVGLGPGLAHQAADQNHFGVPAGRLG